MRLMSLIKVGGITNHATHCYSQCKPRAIAISVPVVPISKFIRFSWLNLPNVNANKINIKFTL